MSCMFTSSVRALFIVRSSTLNNYLIVLYFLNHQISTILHVHVFLTHCLSLKYDP